jgi:hypothetical protein
VALAATVLPAPTSPVSMPMPRSSMSQVSLATASEWAAERNRAEGARSRPNGTRVNP